MSHNPGRDTARYKAWRKWVLATCDPTCIRCGYPIDMALPSTHPDGPSADHEPPLMATGELTPGLDGSGLAHLQCNRQHGGRLAHHTPHAAPALKRDQAKNTTTSKAKRSLNASQTPPAAPSLGYPKKAQNGPVRAQDAPRVHGEGFVLPRLETAVPARVRGTHGPAAVEWLKEAYGMTLRPWQAYALSRALEYDDEGLIWRTVMVTVARQSGKSWLARGLCMWRLHHADLFSETQTILHVANKMETAKEVQRPAVYWAAERYGKRSVKTGNQNPGITLPTGDRWLIQAANDAAGVGYSCSMVFVDEAWRIARSVVDDAIGPTMAERNDPQLYLVSTAGDSTSDLMLTYRDQALSQLDEPRSTLILEWSAPPDADPADEATWQWASPEWSDKRLEFLRAQHGNIEPGAWRREYLNQWIARDDHWLSGAAWSETTDPSRDLPRVGTWCVAVEQDFDGMGHAVAIASLDVDGIIITRVTTHRTIAEVDERLAQIRADYPTLHVQVTPGYAERLRSPFDSLVGQREAAAATQNLLDLFDRRAFRHDGGQLLADHFSGSTISRRQAGWVLSAPMGRKGIYAARALMFALADASRAPKPVAMIRTRNARNRA